MNDSLLLLARAARIAGFPAGLPWPATLTLPKLAALLAGGCTGEHRERFTDWCTALRLAAEAGDLSTATTQREVKQVMRVGFIGRAPRRFIPPHEPLFDDVLTVTPEAAAAWLQDQPKPATVVAWLASAHLPASKQSTKPTPRHEWQENEILRVISELGHEAKAIPKNTPAKPGVKADVRSKFQWSKSIFDKAWDRLRKDKRIKEPD